MIRIAIADDHSLFRRGIAMIINEAENLQLVSEASNGKDLVKALSENPADVVLLDLEMPEMDGVETLAVLKEKFQDVRVVILTMHRDEQFIIHLMQHGANGYLLKDAEPEELERCVEAVYEKGFYASDASYKALMTNATQGFMKIEVPDFAGIVKFSERELEVLKLLCDGLTTQAVADRLFLSPRTIEGYRKRLTEKTGTKNTVELAIFAVQKGLVKK
ncbi:MAG: DNA-binding response regulator [Owenweeksia sp.]|nr:DNA-binding response regulator [Owenweeksia sp.]MBG00439.1 DNA-binding response regulator [Owenweeksia sp.]HBF18732.1 DNA-binding response regulator [Cryomorphaceae bacterium]|tara:strand:- start:1207 stop:1860 length:654 start_codon:yes stop_codon:yes gene_type:complete